MCRDAYTLRVVYKRVTADAGRGLISLTEAAVYDNKLTACLDGSLTLFRPDRDMSVDDMRASASERELGKYLIGNTLIVP